MSQNASDRLVSGWLVNTGAILGGIAALVAAAGFYLKTASHPSWEFYLQVGFFGLTLAFFVGIAMSLQAGYRLFRRYSRIEKPFTLSILAPVAGVVGSTSAIFALWGFFFLAFGFPNASLFLQVGLAGVGLASLLSVGGLTRQFA